MIDCQVILGTSAENGASIWRALDWYYLFTVVAFAVGGAAGFQGIYERYKKDSIVALRSPPGILYLASRGMLPAVMFSGLYSSGSIRGHLTIWALSCGAGVELVLRSQFYVKQTNIRGGLQEEMVRGPFDLLKWYQGLFLEAIAERLAKARLKAVRCVAGGEVPFLSLCDRVDENLGAWPNEDVRGILEGAVLRLREEFRVETSKAVPGRTGAVDQQYRLKLGFVILNNIGYEGLKIVMGSDDAGPIEQAPKENGIKPEQRVSNRVS